jgi:hypothetical protein
MRIMGELTVFLFIQKFIFSKKPNKNDVFFTLQTCMACVLIDVLGLTPTTSGNGSVESEIPLIFENLILIVALADRAQFHYQVLSDPFCISNWFPLSGHQNI